MGRRLWRPIWAACHFAKEPEWGHLGLQLCIPHRCHCGSQVDAHARHSFICKRTPGRTIRHHHLNELIARALSAASIPNTKEPQGRRTYTDLAWIWARFHGSPDDVIQMTVTLLSWRTFPAGQAMETPRVDWLPAYAFMGLTSSTAKSVSNCSGLCTSQQSLASALSSNSVVV